MSGLISYMLTIKVVNHILCVISSLFANIAFLVIEMRSLGGYLILLLNDGSLGRAWGGASPISAILLPLNHYLRKHTIKNIITNSTDATISPIIRS